MFGLSEIKSIRSALLIFSSLISDHLTLYLKMINYCYILTSCSWSKLDQLMHYIWPWCCSIRRILIRNGISITVGQNDHPKRGKISGDQRSATGCGFYSETQSDTEATYMFSIMLIADINLLQSCQTAKIRECSTKKHIKRS